MHKHAGAHKRFSKAFTFSENRISTFNFNIINFEIDLFSGKFVACKSVCVIVYVFIWYGATVFGMCATAPRESSTMTRRRATHTWNAYLPTNELE